MKYFNNLFIQKGGSSDSDKKLKNSEEDSEEKIYKKYCSKYEKIPHILPKAERIIAIGDIHGDMQLTIDCLKLAKVINDDFEWIAEPPNTIVVQIGDQVDRCRPTQSLKCDNPEATPFDEDSDIKILEFFTELNKKARSKGGYVISLLGNHEILNVDGNMDYVSYKGIKQFENEINPETNEKFKSGLEARKYLFKNGNKYAKFLACTRQTAVIIGSNLFVHAAILPNLARKFEINELNLLIKKWLLGIINNSDKIKGIGKLSDILFNYEKSPFWPRFLGNLPPNVSIEDETCVDYLVEPLELYNCNNMIIGHTPQPFTKNKTGINVTCRFQEKEINKGVWRIDVGSSLGFEKFKNNKIKNNTKPQVLEILDDNKFNIIS
jgi:hypothetical protein